MIYGEPSKSILSKTKRHMNKLFRILDLFFHAESTLIRLHQQLHDTVYKTVVICARVGASVATPATMGSAESLNNA